MSGKRRKSNLPNAKTTAALDELDAGGGKLYRGSSREIIKAQMAAARKIMKKRRNALRELAR